MANQTEEFPDRLRRLRKEHGLSQHELAHLAKVTQPTIGNYELGKNYPDLRKCQVLADVLGVKPQYLACWVTR